MRKLAFVLIALAAAWPAGHARAGEDASPAELYRRALVEPMPAAERVRLLELLVREHEESAWADDALWLLGECARQRGDARRVVYYWQLLAGRGGVLKLDELTRAQIPYRLSRAAQATFYLEATGQRYVAGSGGAAGGALIKAEPVDVAMMTVWEGLAHAYLALGRPSLALGAYGAALGHAPPRSPWADQYREAVARLQARAQSALEAAKEPAPAGESGPPDGMAGA